MKICLCVGARPNFMKAAPLIRAFKKHGIPYRLIHTGQHYDKNMSQIFFDELEIPAPDINLGAWVEGDSSSQQIGRSIVIFSRQMELNRPDLIMVLGDVNSTLACALVANKMGIRLAHVEAGERSGDRSMPEEINRILVDEISDYLFCASEEASKNLFWKDNAYLIGDTMIDQLIYSERKTNCIDSVEFGCVRSVAKRLGIQDAELSELFEEIRNTGVNVSDTITALGKVITRLQGPYAVLTIHRAGNVDSRERLEAIIEIVSKVSEKIQVFFPCHPRTKKAMFDIGFRNKADGLFFENPMSYLEFMALVQDAKFVMTDSGGLQVETSYLNIPCLTLRENTERHDTIARGSNTLISLDGDQSLVFDFVDTILKGQWRQSTFKSNPIHDGNASDRIVEILKGEV